MKTISRRIVCLILSVCISFAVSPIMFGINANASGDDYNSVPAIVDSEGMRVIREGVKDSGTYGSAPSVWMPNIDFGSATDLSGYDYFEFDYYVENLSNLKQLASKLELNFVKNGSTGQCSISFLDLLTKDGWNHVKVLVTSATGSSSTMSKTRYIRFRITKNDGVTVADSDRYKTANLVATITAGNESHSFNQSVTVGKNQTEIIVTWIDTVDYNGKVVLTKNGTATEFAAVKRFAEGKGLYSYSATITGLTANTNYTYRIEAGDLTSEEYAYKTKDFDDTFSFVHIADVQYNGNSTLLENWNNTLTRIDTNFPETSFIVNSGDVSDLSGNNNLYQAVKSPELLKQYAVGYVPGNHDDSSNKDGGGYYTLNFASPDTYEAYEGYALNGYDYWYSYNNVLFIALNTMIGDVEYHQDFVTKVVNEQGYKFDWIIVSCHHSLFSASYHSTESATINHRNGLAPLFAELGVDLVLSGHDHVYDRSYLMNGFKPKVDTNSFSTSADGVLYISGTTASGMKYNSAVGSCVSYSAKTVEEEYGFVNYEVSEDEITLTFYNAEDMSVLDKFTLYNDNGDHSVSPDSDLLKNKNLENVSLDSNGNYTVSFESADITDACSIELDFGLANGNTLSAISVSLVDANGNSAKKDFTNIQSGWNHLPASISDFSGIDLTKITAVKLTGAAGTELDIANLYVGHIYTDKDDTTCNCCDNVREKLDDLDPYVIPEMVQSDGMLVIHEGVKDSGTYGSASNIWTPNIDFGENKDLSVYDYFEFDYYVENLDNLKQLASKVELNFVKSDGSQCSINFIDLLTKNGWNHVKVAKSTSSVMSNTRYIRFRITKNDGVTVADADLYKTANLVATVDAINHVPEIVSNQITIYEGKSFSNIYGTPTATGVRSYPAAGNQNISVSEDKKNFSIGDYVEFDYFVDDVAALKDKLTGLHINIVASGNNSGTWVNFIDQITANGWNHIVIEMDDLKYYNNGASSLNMTNVQYVRFRVAFKEAALNAEFADRYAIANVCVTKDVPIPTDVMNDKISFIGAQFKGIKFGAYGYSADVTADITGTRMIELDVYIEDNSNTTIGVELGDSSGAFAYYEFENLTNGWNHLAVRISDMDDADDLDKANITNYALYGVENTTVHAANFYAADYVEGDANRDGVVDIRDLVHMKKYACGNINRGNVVAMDVAGNDYEINSLDLMALIVYLLADK